MFKKRYVFVLILLIFAIISLSTVSASDLNTADEVISNDVLIDDELEQTDDVILEASGNTFTDLNNKISTSGSTVDLDRDYYYTSNDKNLQYGIEINSDLTINGNGYTIYANSARAFKIGENADVTIKEVNFVNSINYSAIMSYGGTIHNSGVLNLEDCTFKNSTAVRYGGAVYSSNFLIVYLCSFIGNSAYEYGIENVSSHGGAIASIGELDVYSSYFILNYAGYSGGAIYNDGEMLIVGSDFEMNMAEFAGAIDNDGFMEVYNSDFNSNEGFSTGGAIYSYGTSEIYYSNFEDNTAEDAGAVYSDNECLFVNSTFIDNHADVDGGAIGNDGDVSIYNSTFIGNSAESSDGGAIDNTGNINVYSSSFVNNSAGDEGGAMWNGSAVNCNFTGNSANYGGAMYNGSADSCIFKDNAASIEGDDTYGTTIIGKIKTKITLQNNDGTLVSKLTRTDTGKGISGAYVIFNINNVNYKVQTDSSGQARLAVPSLDSGTYRVTATYKGNNKYEVSSASIDIAVKANTNLEVVFNNGAREVLATLTNGATGQVIKNANVRFVVDGVKSTVKTDANGQAKVSVSNLALNSHTASVSYDGNSKYNPSTETISFVISKVMTSISQYYDKATKELVATLINSETGAGIKGATIVFNYNGVKTAMTSDKQGQARLYIGDPVVESASLSYGGNSKYLGSYGSIKLQIEKISTVISNFYYKETQEVVATLVNRETGQAIKGATVVFNFNGVKTALKTDKLGQVKLSVDGLSPGEYYISSSYGGNSKYAGSVARIYFVKI